MSKTMFVLVLITAAGSGIMSGLFFAFSNFVMQGLGRIPPAQGIAAMRSINVTVQNPIFFLVFFGTGLLGLALAAASLMRWDEAGMALILAGGLLYIASAIGVTLICNVPMNNSLAALEPTSAEAADYWQRYLREWLAWNHLRCLGTLAAMLAFSLGLSAG